MWNEELYKKRYAATPEETIDGMFTRVAKALAEDDTEFKEFYEIMATKRFLPAGRILRNAGISGYMVNCFFVPLADSRKDIFNALSISMDAQAKGGGVGYDFTPLRPKGSPLSNGGFASGPCSFIDIFDVASATISSTSNRKAANIAVLNVNHPDIMEFIEAKKGNATGGKRWTTFNISVDLTPADMNGPVWDTIVESMWECGDPGLVNLTHARSSDPDVRGVNPCLTGDTRVLTDCGLQRLSDIGTLDVVVNQSGEYAVTDAISSGLKPVFKLTTKAGYNIRVTGNHHIYMKDGTKKAVEDISPGDMVALQHVTLGEDAYRREGMKPYHCEVRDIAAVMGWITGDGYYTDGKIICLVFGKDDDFAMEQINGKMGSLNGQLNPAKQGVNKKSWGAIPRYARYRSQKLINKFEAMGLRPLKAGEKRIPSSVFMMDITAQREFMRALFSADGTINFRPKKSYDVRLSSKSLALIEDTQILLTQHGILSKIYNRSRIRDGATAVLWELIINGEALRKFKKIGFKYSLHKQEKLCKVPDKWDNYGNDKPWSEVKSIEFDGVEEVYNLTVDEVHQYSANGILVANCGEAPLPPYGSCCLGSVVLPVHVKDGEMDHSMLQESARIGAKLLYRVITKTNLPGKQFYKIAKEQKRIGVGITGYAHALIKAGIKYSESEMHIKEWLESMKEAIRKENTESAIVMAIAPTGTTSLFAGVSSGIEPLFSIKTTHVDQTGVHTENDPLWGNYPAHLFETAHTIHPRDHIKIQAAAQSKVDGAVSKTINVPNNYTKEDLGELLKEAMALGLKGVTVFRDGCLPEQVLNTKTMESHKIKTPQGSTRFIIGSQNGRPREIFIILSKPGGDAFAFASALGRMASIALQEGASVERIANSLVNIGSGSMARDTIGDKVVGIESVPDAMGKLLLSRFDLQIETQEASSFCPDCGGMLKRQEGCENCDKCGFSRCG